MAEPVYRRVVIKISGEFLAGKQAFGIDQSTVDRIAGDLIAARQLGAEVAVVVGGGNIVRGVEVSSRGVSRPTGDTMGMLATVMNCLALEAAIERRGMPARSLSAFVMPQICELFTRGATHKYLAEGRIVLLGGGTGNSFFTTDTTAVLRAPEIRAPAVFEPPQSLKHELGGLRTGRAAASMLEPVQVDAYGTHMPLNQLATISVPEPRLLSVQVWDKSMVKAVEKAIVDSNLGLSPATEGQVLRLRIPELNEERRKELVKVAHKYAEAAKVAVRHVRRDGLDTVKKLEKNHEISEDDQERLANEVQKATDGMISEVDQLLAAKEKEILTV